MKGGDLMITFKTDFDPDEIMSDIKDQLKESLLSDSYDVECPHCGKMFDAYPGNNICPHCENEVVLDLDINI